ncbi:MAG: hypothetical protein ACI8ZM_002402 [Crocinitomix sp.]|jgi:hypothetical protein
MIYTIPYCAFRLKTLMRTIEQIDIRKRYPQVF